MEIEVLQDPLTIQEAFPAMKELRPHLRDAEEWSGRVERQMLQGYRLIGIRREGLWVALAGYRVGENLAWGRFLYVDDLVTLPAVRGHGYGSALLDWLVVEAKRLHCEQLHLDSGVQRFAAHRLYHRAGLRISSHHFSEELR